MNPLVPSNNSNKKSMRAAMRGKILHDIIGRISREGEKKVVLIVDDRSMRVISASLGSYDLAEEGLTLIEPLSRIRQPFPQLEAVYLVEPTFDAVNRIIQDFPSYHKRAYSTCHVFFTRKATDPNITKLLLTLTEPESEEERKKKRKTKNKYRMYYEQIPRLSNLMEANVDFLAVEENVFHLDLRKSLVQLFGPSDDWSYWCRERIVDGVASLCATLNEYPYIRYQEGSVLGETLAKSLEERQENLIREDTEFWFHGDNLHGGPSARGLVLFLDRRMDLAAPLLHEFTYQALIYDLLTSRDQLVQYGSSAKERAYLSEADNVWVSLRHLQIPIVIERLSAHVREFRETAAGRYQAGESEQMSLEEMATVIRDLPLFKEVMAKHAMHLAICQEAMDRVNKRDIIKIGTFEQCLITAVDGEGEKLSETKLLTDLANMMRRSEVDPANKLRLACLHAITLGTVSQDVVQKFIRDANPPMSTEASNALLGLASLGLNLITSSSNSSVEVKSKNWFKRGKKSAAPQTEEESVMTAFRAPEFIVRAQRAAKTTDMKMSRHQPLLRNVLETVCNSKLEPELFPFVKSPPPGSGHGGAPADLSGATRAPAHRVTTTERNLSVRTHHATPSKNLGMRNVDSIQETTAVSEVENQIQFLGARVIIFIAGGMTHSEMKTIYEVMKQTKREVILGSTHIIKPDDFVKDLARLGDEDLAKSYLEGNEFEQLSQEAREFYKEDVVDEPEINAPLSEGEKEKLLSEEERKKAEEVKQANPPSFLDKLNCLSAIVNHKYVVCIPGMKSLAKWIDGEDDVIVDEDDEIISDDGLYNCMGCC